MSTRAVVDRAEATVRARMARIIIALVFAVGLLGFAPSVSVQTAEAAGCYPWISSFSANAVTFAIYGTGAATCSYSAQRSLQACLRVAWPGFFDQDYRCSQSSLASFTGSGYNYYASVSASICNREVWLESRLDGTARSWHAYMGRCP